MSETTRGIGCPNVTCPVCGPGECACGYISDRSYSPEQHAPDEPVREPESDGREGGAA